MLTPKHMARDLIAYSFGFGDPADIYEGLARSPIPASLIRRASPKRAEFVRRFIQSTPVGQLLFIHVPKNSGTSVKKALYSYDPGHATARYYQMIAPDLLTTVDSMAIIREPVDRFLSAFDFVRNRGGSDVPISRKSTQRLSRIQTIDDFLAHLEQIGGRWFLTDHVARPQWWYIADGSNRIAVKHLWLFDQQNEGLSRFLASYGIQDLPVLNRTSRVSRDLTALQTERLRKLYAPDFAIYEKMLSGASDTDLYLKLLSDLAS